MLYLYEEFNKIHTKDGHRVKFIELNYTQFRVLLLINS